jgi:predicted phage terminase large subunit-like protein
MSFKAINRDADGNDYALWPEMRSLEWLYEKKESLESIGRVSAFYREYQCEVIGDSDQLFRETDLQYYEGDLSDGYIIHSSTERKTPVNVFMGVDPASSVRATADYTCIMVIGMDADKNVYVIDYLRKRIKPMDVADSILSWYNKYKPMKVQIETVGYQEMLRDYLTRLEGVYIPGLAIKNQPRKGKVQRLEGMQPMFARKKVYVKKGHSEFIDEVLIFPRGKHDDTLDAFFYAVKGAFPPYEEEGYRNNEDMPNVRRVSYDWMVE